MKKTVRSILAVALAVALISSFAFAGASTLVEKSITVENGIDVYMNGNVFTPTDVNGDEVELFVYNGTTYAPIRAISEALGFDVDYDAATGTAYVTELAGDVEKAAEYLETMFGVKFNDEVTNGEFNSALAIIATGAEDAPQTGELVPATVGEALVAAINAARMTELCATYTAEKAAEIIEAAGVAFEVSEDDAPVYACALDLNLVNPNTAPTAVLNGTVATKLAMAVAQMTGNGRKYIGRISDADIVSKVINACEQLTTVYDGGTLAELGPKMLEDEIITGFGLKYAGYDANFLPEYTIQYGHDNAVQAAQLVTVLDSMGIDGYVQIEPKTSVYIYGTVIYANEYDMQIEFDTVEDMKAFDAVAKQYVQKFPENMNEDGSFDGLLVEPWWTPLYSALVEVDENYGKMYSNIIANGDYQLQIFSTEEGVTEIAEYVEAADVDVEITVFPRYANMAFAKDYLPTGTAVTETLEDTEATEEVEGTETVEGVEGTEATEEVEDAAE